MQKCLYSINFVCFLHVHFLLVTYKSAYYIELIEGSGIGGSNSHLSQCILHNKNKKLITVTINSYSFVYTQIPSLIGEDWCLVTFVEDIRDEHIVSTLEVLNEKI